MFLFLFKVYIVWLRGRLDVWSDDDEDMVFKWIERFVMIFIDFDLDSCE